MSVLLCIAGRDNEAGQLPDIPVGAYVGYFDAAGRRLVFVQPASGGLAWLYLSEDWSKAFVMRDGLLPREIVLSSPEAAWAMACWRAARLGRQ